MRKAVIIGINDYPSAPLKGCVSDANKISALLERHDDERKNFGVKKVVSPDKCDKAILKQHIDGLFQDKVDVALFYFSGHGYVNSIGGYLVTTDAKQYDEGISMDEILRMASKLKTRERIIILDCCHAGQMGDNDIEESTAHIREGVTILTSSTKLQPSLEYADGGVFTALVCDALAGGAADLLGRVTVGGIYAYVDKTLGEWEQRPIFKTNVSRFTALRQCKEQIDLAILKNIPRFFPAADCDFPLDPSYEPDEEPEDNAHEAIFGELQKLCGVNLLKPVDEEHMCYAALHNKSCGLTAFGKQYWKLAKEGKI